MTIKFKNLIILMLLGLMTSAYAGTLTSDDVSKILYNKIQNETKQQLSGVSEDFKIKIFGIPNDTIRTLDSNPLKIETISQNSSFSSNSYKRVVVKDYKNNIVKAFPINVQTLVYKDVMVAGDTIPYNFEIKAENLKIEKREISKYIGKTMSNFKEGLVAKRNFQKGSLIISDYVKAKSVVSKNSIVEIIFLSDKGLRITLQGKALKDGGIGDTIPVRSDKYNKIYNAKISSANEVMVRI